MLPNQYLQLPCLQAREWQVLMAKLRNTTCSIDEGWMTSHTKPCPGCGSRIQRISGCNHMICSQCHMHFCWVSIALHPALAV